MRAVAERGGDWLANAVGVGGGGARKGWGVSAGGETPHWHTCAGRGRRVGGSAPACTRHCAGRYVGRRRTSPRRSVSRWPCSTCHVAGCGTWMTWSLSQHKSWGPWDCSAEATAGRNHNGQCSLQAVQKGYRRGTTGEPPHQPRANALTENGRPARSSTAAQQTKKIQRNRYMVDPITDLLVSTR